jgi:hypothetical protein
MNGVLSAEGAKLVHFQTVGSILLILAGVVVALFALRASEGDLNSCAGFCHFSAPPYTMFGPMTRKKRRIRLFACPQAMPNPSVVP